MDALPRPPSPLIYASSSTKTQTNIAFHIFNLNKTHWDSDRNMWTKQIKHIHPKNRSLLFIAILILVLVWRHFSSVINIKNNIFSSRWIVFRGIERMFGSVVAVAFQIAFYAEKYANNVFSFFKNHFWYQHIDTTKRLMSSPKCRSVEVINNPARPGSNHREVNCINYK